MVGLEIFGIRTIKELFTYFGIEPKIKKGSNSLYNIISHRRPKLFVEKCQKTVRAWGLEVLHLKHGSLDLLRGKDALKALIFFFGDAK